MTETESARALLYRHGLPEDVIDGALCLFAQELAGKIRARFDGSILDDVREQDADLISPENWARITAAAVPSAPADRAAGVAEAIRTFPFDNFGMDDVSFALEDDPEAQEWVPALAAAVLATLPATTARAVEVRDYWHAEAMSATTRIIELEGQLEELRRAAAAPADRAALAEDLRYVLNYRGPGHAHDRPGVWDTSGKPCEHCARLAAAQRNLAAYDADPDAVLPASVDRAAEWRAAADHIEAMRGYPSLMVPEEAVDELRRVADEAQQPETEARRACTNCGHFICNGNGPCGAIVSLSAVSDEKRCPCVGDTAEEPAVGAQQPKEAHAPETVAYQSKGGRLLRCLAHAPEWAAILCGDFHPVTSEDLPDGGLCTAPVSLDERCGVDVLIPQPSKEA